MPHPSHRKGTKDRTSDHLELLGLLMRGTVHRSRREETDVVRHFVESHQVIDPRGGRQRAHLPVLGIDGG